jgi:hypothetical protein
MYIFGFIISQNTFQIGVIAIIFLRHCHPSLLDESLNERSDIFADIAAFGDPFI